MGLQRSAFFNTAIYFGDDLGHALSYGESFEQPVSIVRMNGDVESLSSHIKREGELIHIEVVRETTSQHAEMRVPVTTSPMDAEELILSLTLELLLS
jgi:hypothetical protein